MTTVKVEDMNEDRMWCRCYYDYRCRNDCLMVTVDTKGLVAGEKGKSGRSFR